MGREQRWAASGEWRWRPVAALSGVAALLSVLCAGAAWSAEEELVTALFAFQATALCAYVALLWVPPPRPGPDTAS